MLPNITRISQSLRLLVAAFILALVGMAQARAQATSWPDKPVLLLVPYGAGSPPDLVARVVAQHLGVAPVIPRFMSV